MVLKFYNPFIYSSSITIDFISKGTCILYWSMCSRQLLANSSTRYLFFTGSCYFFKVSIININRARGLPERLFFFVFDSSDSYRLIDLRSLSFWRKFRNYGYSLSLSMVCLILLTKGSKHYSWTYSPLYIRLN